MGGVDNLFQPRERRHEIREAELERVFHADARAEIRRRHLERRRTDRGARLREHGVQPDRAQQRALPRHVRPGNQQERPSRSDLDVVRDATAVGQERMAKGRGPQRVDGGVDPRTGPGGLIGARPSPAWRARPPNPTRQSTRARAGRRARASDEARSRRGNPTTSVPEPRSGPWGSRVEARTTRRGGPAWRGHRAPRRPHTSPAAASRAPPPSRTRDRPATASPRTAAWRARRVTRDRTTAYIQNANPRDRRMAAASGIIHQGPR